MDIERRDRLRRIDRIAEKMGHYSGWQRCTWCWKWGKTTLFPTAEDIAWGMVQLTHVDAYVKIVLCDRCIELAEPPWYPNASDRAANAMQLFLPRELSDTPGLLKHMSWFVVENDP